MIKIVIKKILQIFGWRLVKISNPPKILSPENNEVIIDCYRKSKGIIHIGAHRGTEAPIYAWFNKSVIWIEPNKDIFGELKLNISNYKNQKAYNYLLHETNQKEVKFKISNNDGASSSIYDFGEHHKNSILFGKRKFKFTKIIKMETYSFDNFINQEKINIREFDLWIIDVQGSELPVIKGSQNSLKFCKYLVTEISKKEFYKGGTKWIDLLQWLRENKFEMIFEPEKDHDNAIFKNVSI